jgi:hypothetical protein
MPKKPTIPTPPTETIPDECAVCGQKIDKRSSGSLEWHANPKPHLPWSGQKAKKVWRR